MITLVIVFGMLIAFGTGAYTGIKAIHIGLKFQTQITKGIEPKMSTPVKDFFDRKEEEKAVNKTNEMIADIFE